MSAWSQIKAAFGKFFVKMLLNEKGELSFGKLGGFVVSLCIAIMGAKQIGIFLPEWMVHWSYIVVAAGTALGFAGFRDAISSIGSKNKPKE